MFESDESRRGRFNSGLHHETSAQQFQGIAHGLVHERSNASVCKHDTHIELIVELAGSSRSVVTFHQSVVDLPCVGRGLDILIVGVVIDAQHLDVELVEKFVGDENRKFLRNGGGENGESTAPELAESLNVENVCECVTHVDVKIGTCCKGS